MPGEELPDEDDWRAWGFPAPPPSPACAPPPPRCAADWGGSPGAHPHRARLPALPLIAVCSSVLLVALLVAAFLLWRHKKRVQSSPPCKTEQPGEATPGYGDAYLNHRNQAMGSLMPLEILDVKLGAMGPQLPTLPHPPFYPRGHPVGGSSPNPVYEEVSPALVGGPSPFLSTDSDFRRDSGQCSATSSVRGSTGGDLSRDPVSSDEEDFSYAPKSRTRTQKGMFPVQRPKGDMRPIPDSFWHNPNGHPPDASQENIYATIDEEGAYCPAPGLRPSRDRRLTHEGGGSYGDILPVYGSSVFL